MENLARTKKILYWAIGIFVVVAIYFLTPPAEFKRTLFPLVAILGVIFLVLGAMLTAIARKEKGKLKILLMLTGISAMTPALAAVLHNVFYALSKYFPGLEILLNALGTVAFILALMVAPLIFVGGSLSLIAIFNKKDKE